ncbi:hypothetical protein GO988_15485 [Hymenobacter sp. HMF4947]|uniref:Uncharacterized protein n=1 Tax=Hymenobacter ginkgonis TaxID=2682976 RepID=A0A7K1TH47_9BACT|nr:hypothetical protein [Hymenobacter ginkgonis]MVN77735.1 hypothetical protein [Hymenobacter ginkgonis]
MADKEPTLTLDQQIEALKQQLAEQNSIIEGQAEQLKAAEAQGAGALPVVTHEKKRYQVLARKFIHKEVEIDANSLKTDKDLVKALVESGTGILKALD